MASYTNLKDALAAFERQVVAQIHSTKADSKALNDRVVNVSADASKALSAITDEHNERVLATAELRNELLNEISKIQGVEKIICTNRNNTPLGVSFDLDDSSARVHIEGNLAANEAKQNGMYFVLLANDKRVAFKKYEIYLPINGVWEKLSVSNGEESTSITIDDDQLRSIQRETEN